MIGAANRAHGGKEQYQQRQRPRSDSIYLPDQFAPFEGETHTTTTLKYLPLKHLPREPVSGTPTGSTRISTDPVYAATGCSLNQPCRLFL